MSKVTYAVPNIHCQHCVHTIETEIRELEGVISVKADLATKKVEIEFREPANEELLIKKLREINYPPAIS
mgnify:FL=1